eukprot:3927122-Rhodomonas_salina.2
MLSAVSWLGCPESTINTTSNVKYGLDESVSSMYMSPSTCPWGPTPPSDTSDARAALNFPLSRVCIARGEGMQPTPTRDASQSRLPAQQASVPAFDAFIISQRTIFVSKLVPNSPPRSTSPIFVKFVT